LGNNAQDAPSAFPPPLFLHQFLPPAFVCSRSFAQHSSAPAVAQVVHSVSQR